MFLDFYGFTIMFLSYVFGVFVIITQVTAYEVQTKLLLLSLFG